MDMNDEMKNDLVEFQQLQQQLQVVLMQAQQIAYQISEIDKVEEELKKSSPGKLFRFAGSVMVEKDAKTLEKELGEERDDLNVKKQFMEKQEKRVKDRMDVIKKKFDAIEKGAAGKQQPSRKSE